MPYLQQILTYKNDPRQLEALYQAACCDGETAQFSADLDASFHDDPENVLLQAWHYRLQNGQEGSLQREAPALKTGFISFAHWKLAVPLAILDGLIFWVLSDPRLNFPGDAPLLALLAMPVIALSLMTFLSLASSKNTRRSLAAGGALVALLALAYLLYRLSAPYISQHYLLLIILHLTLLGWAAVGASLVGLANDADNRFAFLIKSLEAAVVGGVYLVVGMIFGGVTLLMFEALGVSLPAPIIRLIAAGGAGLIPLIAVATIYDPLAEPARQDFSQGLSKFIGLMMRLLLPLTLGVLVVYIFVIPFNLMQPFTNRDVLIVYNIMLFGVMGMLVGATPISLEGLSPRLSAALRWGILAVAALAGLVSLYALTAILYRTFTSLPTINRLTMAGWNIINIALLALIIIRLLRQIDKPWNERIQGVFSLAAVVYVVWSLFVIVAMPLIFR